MVVHSILLFAILVATQIDDRKSSQDLPEITSVSLSTHSPFTIKPCQSVDLALEIKMASPIDITTRRQALHRISQSVRVNGYEYRNRLSNNSGMNDAAIFELGDLPTANEMPNRESSSFLVTLRMFVDAEAKDCLFSVSGEYDVELNVLGDSFRFTITVEPPTRTEEQIVSQLRDLKILLFLLDPTDRQYATPAIFDILDPLTRVESAYQPMLSQAVGVAIAKGKFKVPIDMGTPEGEKAYMEAVYQRLSRFCDGQIESRLEALASYSCALVAGRLSGIANEKAQADQYLATRNQLWSRVRKSPFSGDVGRAADKLLKQVEKARKVENPGK